MGDIIVQTSLLGRSKNRVVFREDEGGSHHVELCGGRRVGIGLDVNTEPAEMGVAVDSVPRVEYEFILPEGEEFEVPGLGLLEKMVIRHERG